MQAPSDAALQRVSGRELQLQWKPGFSDASSRHKTDCPLRPSFNNALSIAEPR